MVAAEVKILAFAGSIRTGSFNAQLLKIAGEGVMAAGGQLTLIDLKDYVLPLYNSDLEAAQGIPVAAKELKKLAKAHAGFLIASPEYNGGYTPLLKNTLDWMSRRDGKDEPELAAFKDKAVGLVAASPGRSGGLRSLSQISAVMGCLHMVVMPFPVGVGSAGNAFDGGKLKDENLAARVRGVGSQLVQFLWQRR